MKAIDFTFSITPHAGLADKLAIQFGFIYALGTSCGWRFRLIEPVVCIRQEQYDSRRRKLVKKIARLTGVQRTSFYRKVFPMDSLSCYLGLDKAEASSSDYGLILEMPLADLLADANSVADINRKLEPRLEASELQQQSPRDHELQEGLNPISDEAHDALDRKSRVLLKITKDRSFYLLLDRIKAVLEMDGGDIIAIAGEGYLRPNLLRHGSASLPPGQLSNQTRQLMETTSLQSIVLVHLRLGDSLYLSTPEGYLILHGRMSYFSFQEYFEKVKPIDPDRFPWFDPYQVSHKVRMELDQRNIDPASTYVISDGFASSRATVKKTARTYPERLGGAFQAAAQRRIDELEQEFYRAFDWVPRERMVIGEGNEETILSIHLIAHCRLILCNSGGFSLFMSHIYGNPQAKPEFVWLVKDF